jgi:O-succinylbenzoic acid--CoA ligase
MSPLIELLSHPSRDPFIVGNNITLSYGETVEAIRRTLAILTHKGIAPHSVVALQTDRDSPSIITLLALLKLECSVLVIHSRWPQSMLIGAIQKVTSSHIISAPALDKIEIRPSCDTHHKPNWARQAAIVVATSGSTGEPKLALLPLSALLMSARTSAPACALTRNDCWHLSLPLFHVGGLGILFRTLITGSSLSLANSIENTKESATTHLSLVPTQLYRLLTNPASRGMLRRQKAIMLGGAPIGARIVSEALRNNIPIMTTYGLTEMGSAVTLASSPIIATNSSVSIGLPLPGREIKLSADGEVLTRGDTLFAGYITTEGVSLPLIEGGWFPTGDIGQALPDGTLSIIGRRDAQFISGGENIHPEMIENALTSLPDISAACVVPIPDREFGHRPFAFVVSKVALLDLNDIREALRPLVPSFALPIGIQEAPEELLTPTGKISRSMAVRAASKR